MSDTFIISGSGSPTAGGASTTVVQPTASNLNAQVQGTSAADSAASGNPVLVGGVDNAGNVQELPVADIGSSIPSQLLIVGGDDALGNARALPISVDGATVPLSILNVGGKDGVGNIRSMPVGGVGATAPLGAIQVGGKDGSGNTQAFATDTSGRLTMVGAAAADAAASGNPVLIGGVDAAGNVQELPVADAGAAAPAQIVNVGGFDNAGNMQALPIAANSSTIPARSLFIGGSDGVNTQPIKTDTSGRPIIVGAAAADAAQAGNPVLVAGVDNAGNVQELPVADAGTTTPAQTLIVGGVDGAGLARQFVTDGGGAIVISANAGTAVADGSTNTPFQISTAAGNPSPIVITYPKLFNGTTWDRQRSATIGNNVAATGIMADAPYGQYNTTAPAPATGNYSALQTDYAGSLFTVKRRSQTKAQATTIASSSATTTILAAQAAGIFADISNIFISPTPAATTDISFTATLSDGTNSYIFDMDTGALATNTADPTFVNIAFDPPLAATTAATAWTLTLSVNTVTVHVTVNSVLQKAS